LDGGGEWHLPAVYTTAVLKAELEDPIPTRFLPEEQGTSTGHLAFNPGKSIGNLTGGPETGAPVCPATSSDKDRGAPSRANDLRNTQRRTSWRTASSPWPAACQRVHGRCRDVLPFECMLPRYRPCGR
jgi:hypothetical protein